MHDLRTLKALVTEIHGLQTELLEVDPAIASPLDQVGARVDQELKETFDVDLSDPEQARVAAAVVIYTYNFGRAAMNGLLTQVVSKHREAVSDV